jgi:hypothetical protein
MKGRVERHDRHPRSEDFGHGREIVVHGDAPTHLAVDDDSGFGDAGEPAGQGLVTAQLEVAGDVSIHERSGNVAYRRHHRFLQKAFRPPAGIPEDPASVKVRIAFAALTSGGQSHSGQGEMVVRIVQPGTHRNRTKKLAAPYRNGMIAFREHRWRAPGVRRQR